MTSINAKVAEWTDAGQAETFTDEYGATWRYVVDAMDGTVAVECHDRAGEFVWSKSEPDGGTIYFKNDGDTYAVNNPGEYVVEGGKWVAGVEADLAD